MTQSRTPTAVFATGLAESRERGLAAAAVALRGGRLVQLPLETGYALVGDAFSAPAVARLREIRKRPELVPQVLVPNARTVSGIAVVSAMAEELMEAFWPGPLTLLLPSQPSLAWTVTQRGAAVPVRMPLQPVALELLRRTGPLTTIPLPDWACHPAVFLAADPWPANHAAPNSSSVVDATAFPPVLLRLGGYELAVLQEACPDLVSGIVGG